jgi:hypothetical protein
MRLKILLLIGLLCTPLVLLADSPPELNAVEEEELVIEEAEEAEEAELELEEEVTPILQGFVIKHKLGEAEPTAGIELSPSVFGLLSRFRHDVAHYASQNQPLDLMTEINAVFVDDLQENLSQLPTLILNTSVDEQNQGHSRFDIASYQHEIHDEDSGETITVNWQGLDGQLTYPISFAEIKLDLILQGLSIVDSQFALELGRWTLITALDKDLFPMKLNSNLPSLTIRDEEQIITASDISLNFDTSYTSSEVEISQGEFSIDEISINEADMDIGRVQKLNLTFGGEELDGSAFLHTKLAIEKFLLSGDDAIESSKQLTLELNRIDAVALASLQKTVRELQTKLNEGAISEEIFNFAIFGQFMQLAPQFLAKNPELALSKFQLNTSEGNLLADLHLGIDGSKTKSLADTAELMMALLFKAELSIDHNLLERALITVSGDKAQAQAHIEALVKDRTLLKEGRKYTLSANIKENKLSLNGQDMGTPTDLLMLLLPFISDSE